MREIRCNWDEESSTHQCSDSAHNALVEVLAEALQDLAETVGQVAVGEQLPTGAFKRSAYSRKSEAEESAPAPTDAVGSPTSAQEAVPYPVSSSSSPPSSLVVPESPSAPTDSVEAAGSHRNLQNAEGMLENCENHLAGQH